MRIVVSAVQVHLMKSVDIFRSVGSLLAEVQVTKEPGPLVTTQQQYNCVRTFILDWLQKTQDNFMSLLAQSETVLERHVFQFQLLDHSVDDI